MKREEERSALEDSAVALAVAMLYHTGTLEFFMSESVAQEPCLDGLRRYTPTLSKFVLKLIRVSFQRFSVSYKRGDFDVTLSELYRILFSLATSIQRDVLRRSACWNY